MSKVFAWSAADDELASCGEKLRHEDSFNNLGAVPKGVLITDDEVRKSSPSGLSFVFVDAHQEEL